jgi:hypothetical protein
MMDVDRVRGRRQGGPRLCPIVSFQRTFNVLIEWYHLSCLRPSPRLRHLGWVSIRLDLQVVDVPARIATLGGKRGVVSPRTQVV